MKKRPLKILCVGDLHLGRQPSRIPFDNPALTVAAIWQQIVSTAIDEAVDLVTLTGDVIDRENSYYEAFGPLEQGLRRLKNAHIPTFAITGNHDFDLLPRQAALLGPEHLHLLGEGGRWESVIFERNGEPALEILGWSYPAQHVTSSPIPDLRRARPDLPAIALLHADLDHSTSLYAPIQTAELEEKPVNAWLLGHIHRPALKKTPAQNLILIPGTPQPLHPGEKNTHGPWLIELYPDGLTHARQLPLATLRYQELPIDLTDIDHLDELQILLPSQIRDDVIALYNDLPTLRHVVYSLDLHGRSPLHRELLTNTPKLIQELELSFDELRATVDTIHINTSPAIDLPTLASSPDLTGALANLLLNIQTKTISDEYRPLFDSLKKTLRPIYEANAFAPLRQHRLSADFLDDDQLHQMVYRQGLTLLAELLLQKEKEPRR